MNHLKVFESFTKTWREIPVIDYKSQKENDRLKFSDKELDKISNMGGLFLGPPGKKWESQYMTRITSNCYSCSGSGHSYLLSGSIKHGATRISDGPCYDCRGRGYESEMEAIKVSDGYYLIYYEDRPHQIKSFEIDGLSNFLKYWKILYLRFVGNKINKSDYVDDEFMNLFVWK